MLLSDRPHNESDLLRISNVQFLRGLAAPALMGACPGTLCPVPLVRSWIRSGDAEQIARVLRVPVQLPARSLLPGGVWGPASHPLHAQ